MFASVSGSEFSFCVTIRLIVVSGEQRNVVIVICFKTSNTSLLPLSYSGLFQHANE
jgi:hypothetical protein